MITAVLAWGGPGNVQEGKIEGVVEAIGEAIEAKEIAGGVTVVGTREGIVHTAAHGAADLEAGRPMREDAIFWVASMTKPITGVAVMMMVDEGKVSVDDPVAKYLPELAGLKTKDGKEARITIKHLLTHTSGMGEISGEEAKGCRTLAEAVALYATKPVGFEPGTEWRYCQSGINTAARVVEVVSGTDFATFLDERLFGPLGMKDSTFYLTEEQAGRLAKSYKRTEGGLEPQEVWILNGAKATDRGRFPAANGGLFSTAGDYAKFCQMLLNGGEWEGKKYLSAEAMGEMTKVQSGDLVTGFTKGNGWGLGCCVVREPQGVSEVLSPGTFGHGGAYGTQAWIDPLKGRFYLLMVQRANFPNADDSGVRKAFQEEAAKALDKK
jgi:CubicO group peptidase (beta-lactamase class C family)